MYCNFFGMRCRPFESRVDTQFTYITSEYEETLAAVEYEVRYGQKFALVLGESGTGKSQLVRTLLLRFHRTDHALVIKFHADHKMDLVRETCKGFGLTLSDSESPQNRISRLGRHLQRNTKTENRWILIIDQAENLTPENLSQLATLTDMQGQDDPLLSIVLVAQPRFRSFIDESSHDRLRQQLVNARSISNFTPVQTEGYILHRLIVAGAGDAEIFDKDAIALIHDASGGVPRLINHYCNAAMLAAYGARELRITPQIVLEITRSNITDQRSVPAQELGLHSSRQVEVGPPATETNVGRSAIRRTFQTPPSTDMDASQPPDTHREVDHQPLSSISSDVGISNVGRPHGLAGDMESLFASGETLLQRLERALAKADRMTGTSEAAMNQFVAVEKHIDSVTTSSERYVNQLEDTVKRGNDTLGKLQERLQRHHSGTDQRLTQIEGRMARVLKASEEIEDRIERANRVCDRVDQAEAKVKRSAEKLSHRAEDVQQRTIELNAAVKSSSQAKETLETLTQNTVLATRKARQEIGDVITVLQDRMDHGERLSEQFSEEALKSYDEKYQQQLAQYEESKKEALVDMENALQVGVDSARQQLTQYDQSRKEAIAELKNTMRESVEAAQQFTRRAISSCQGKLQEQVEQYQEALNEALASRLAKSQAKLATMINSTRKDIQEMAERVKWVESKRKQAEQWATPLCQDADKVADQIANLHGRLQKVRTTIDDMTGRAETANVNLSATVQRGEQLLSGVQTSQTQIETQRQNIVNSLNEVDRATQCIKELREQTDTCEKAIQRLSFENESGEKTVQRVKQLSDHVESLQVNLQTSVTEAAEKIGQLDTRTTAVNGVIHNLTELNTTGQNTADKVQKIVCSAQDVIEIVNKQNDRLDQALKLKDTLEDAQNLYEAMQGLVSHSDVKINELQSHHSEAARVIDVLSKHKTHIDLFIERTSDAEEASGKLNRQIEEVWSLTTKTETESKKLSQRIEEATTLIENLSTATHPALGVAQELTEKAEKIAQYKKDMDSGLAQAGKLVGRLGSITRVLSAAKNTETSVKRTIEDVRAAHQELAATVEDAAKHSTALQDLSASSHGLIETHHQLQQETSATTEQLAHQLATTQNSVESGERLLKDFVAQAETLNDRFVALDKKANEIQSMITENMDAPDKVIKKVKQQTAHLHQVSAAVRKVFAGLSQATLQAQQRANELKQSTHSSDQQLSSVTSQTRHVTQTLQQCIEEAVRAQSRLQNTLNDCSSIQENQSRESMLNLTRISAIPRNQSGEAGELSMLSEPSTPDSRPKNRLNPPAGADEITRMIEDAKRATSGAGS